MITPTEALGLSGATLETRTRQAMRHVSDAMLVRIARRLEDDARINEVTYERDGVSEPVRIILRPLLVMPEQIAYVHQVCTRLHDALKRVPLLYLEDPVVRRVLRISDAEDAWLRDAWGKHHERVNPVYSRLDAVCNFSGAGWRESLQFMEPNLSGVGGIHYGPLAEELVMRDVVPTILAHDPYLQIELPRDQRELFLQMLLDHAQAIGRPRANLCFIEPKYTPGGSNEQPALVRYVGSKHDGTVVHADPRELRLVGDEVYYEDVRVDVAYRDYETRDLIALGQAEGHDLAGMRALFRQNRVVSSIGADFDHKSCWEVLTDETIAARYFTAEERRLFGKHVLWTRVVYDRRTSLPRGDGDLLEMIRTQREELVLKPSRGFGGQGIHIGRLTPQADWEALIDEAVRLSDDPHRSWVVQQATALPVHEFPMVGADGRVHEEPFYVVMGFAATDGGLGVLCRVSQKQVVNVAQRGGLAAALIGHAPSELRAPLRAPLRSHGAEERLRSQISDLRGLETAIGLLGWDEETYLPEGARGGRGEQLATLESLRHRLLTADALGDVVEEAALHAAPDSLLEAELARLRRLRRIALALPDELVRAFAQARSHTLARWEQARKEDDFGLFAPALLRLLGLVRERAQALQRTDELYDGLLDEHEPAMTRARLDPILLALRIRLPPLVSALAERTARETDRLPRGRYPDQLQERLCHDLLTDMGFDFRRGRFDRSTHPFTLMAGEDDVRVTLRVHEDNPLPAVFTTLHEGGHALYDQGFGRELHGTLLAEGPGMGIHESQARLWENSIGRSRAFWEHWFPKLRAAFPEALGSLDAAAACRAVNVVRPGVNRVEADEVTYNLHIVLRYELELSLLSGDLPVEDLPLAWAEQSQRLLGVHPTNALDGCLQDVHWALGAFGYFPTYALGNLCAAQLMEAFRGEHPGFDAELAAGQMGTLLGWLRRHIHQHGHRYGADQLIERATGKPLDAEAFFRALAERHEISLAAP
jgi:carboxypeptidase Taq